MPAAFVLLNLTIIVLLAIVGWLVGKNHKAALSAIVVAPMIAFFGWHAQMRPDLLTMFFPFSGIYFLSNWFPFAVALAAPGVLSLTKDKPQMVRTGVLLGILFGATLLNYRDYFIPLADSRETIIDKDGICRQSGPDTCSSAAIVTLLRMHGIEITESAAIQLARTKESRGTTQLGVYRALAIASNKKSMRAELLFTDPGQLIEINEPAIVTVGLPKNPGPAAIAFGLKYTWQPGVWHDVVFLGVDPKRPDRILIGEPDFGLEKWPVEHFEMLFTGHAAKLSEGRS